jgi:hypothetical protein
MSRAQQETPARPQFECPVDGFQQMINGKYKLRILWALKFGPRRYGEIKKGLTFEGGHLFFLMKERQKFLEKLSIDLIK